MKEVEAATDAIEVSYRLFSQAERRPLRLISTVGWNCRDKHPTRSRITITGRRPSSYVMAPKIRVVGWLPHGQRLDGHVAATAIKGFSPSVLFSKLKPGARIDPHTGLLNCA